MSLAVSMPRVAGASRVLIVDDDALQTESMATLLGREFRLSLATSTNEALAKLNSDQDIAVILSDLKMPGMGGIEFLEQAREILPNARRLVLSGHVDLRVFLDATNRARVSRLLTKPSPPAAILAAVRDAAREFQDAEAASAESTNQIALLTAQLQQMSRLAMLGTMAGSAGHEFANWTAAFRGILAGLATEPKLGAQITPAELSDLIRIAEQLHSHSNALMQLARPRRPSIIERVDFNNVVRSTVSLLVSAGIAHSVSTTSRYTDEELPVDVSVSEFEQVILNLCKNAIDASDGGTLRELQITTSRESCFAVCCVVDNGCGIPADKLDAVFDPYYTTKSPGKGTGLGLHIVRGIVESHAGTLQIQSSPCGTAVRLRIPLQCGE